MTGPSPAMTMELYFGIRLLGLFSRCKYNCKSDICYREKRQIMTESEFVELFRKLGARNPKMWAQSQLEENLPQLARLLFLRQAWKLVVRENDVNWISEARQIKSDGPGGDIGPALARLLSADCLERDLTKIVRVMQWRLLSGLCQLLDD